jgi:hypothetical protein
MKKVQTPEQTAYEKAIRYLSQVEDIDLMINEKQEMIDNLWSIASGTSMNLTADKVQTSPGDKIGNITVKLVDLEKEITNDIDNLINLKADVMRTIDRYVDNMKQRKVLYARYLRFQAIQTTARELHVSERTAYRMHVSGVQKVAQRFGYEDIDK